MAIVILMASIVVQFYTAGLALYQIRKTGRVRAWLFIAAALLFMGVRRSVPLIQALSWGTARIDLVAETIGLVISILMLLGVRSIGEVFNYLNRLRIEAEEEVEKRKKSALDLRESEENLRVILQSIGDAVIATDIAGRIIHLNPMAEQLTGWSVDEALGKHLPQVLRLINPQTRAEAENPVLRVLNEGIMVGLSNRALLSRRDGREYQIADSCAPITSAGGKIMGAVLVFRDMTEENARRDALLESEMRLRFLSDHLPNGLVYQIDSGIDGRERHFTYISGGVEQLHEITAEEALQDASRIYRQICEEDRQRVIEREATAVAAMASFQAEVRVNLPSGKTQWRYFASAPRRLSNQHLVWDGIEIDITARKLAEQEQQRMQTLESLGTVAGGIAHDFNNLLMGIFGNLELARLELTPDHPAVKFLDSAHQAMDNARQLTTRLLTFAQGGNPVMETVDLQRRIRENVLFNLTGSNVAAHFDLPSDLWPVKADKSQLAQVIANLTINAKEAMPTGGNLYIAAQNIHEPAELELRGDYVKLIFRDEGVGIPGTLLAKIFDPYFTTKPGGRGLGLAITHGIVNKHKGRISVESTPQKGSTFTLFLPVDLAERSQAGSLPQRSDAAHPSGWRVLVMDDEALIRKITSRMLEQLGCRVETAVDGRDAIEKYEAALRNGQRFDLTIMDLTIPGGMGGKETIQELLALDPTAKVVVASGYSSDPVLSDCARYGFAGYLAKPFQLNELKQELARILDS